MTVFIWIIKTDANIFSYICMSKGCKKGYEIHFWDAILVGIEVVYVNLKYIVVDGE